MSLGANAKLPTVREICKAMKISAVTAEVVLTGLEEQGVLTRRQGSGIYVSPRLYQKSVGLVFGRSAFAPGASPFCGLLIDHSRRRAENHNEIFSFYMDLPGMATEPGCPVHADLAAALGKRTIDGVLLSQRHSAEQERWLRTQVPVVTFCGGVAKPFAPGNVGFDLQEMATLAAKELATRGCRRVAMISAYDSGADIFPAALGAVGLPVEPKRLLLPLKENPDNEPRLTIGARAMRQLLAATDAPDGVIVMDDMLATGAIAACNEAGRVVGQDVVLASHANRGSPTLQPYEQQLILVEVDPGEIVEAMFDMLEGMMAGRTDHQPAAVNVKLSVKAGPAVRRAGS